MITIKQGIALTERNTTGPPAVIRLEAAKRYRLTCAGEAASSLIIVRRGVLQTTTDDRRQSKTILAPYTMCRRASNNQLY